MIPQNSHSQLPYPTVWENVSTSSLQQNIPHSEALERVKKTLKAVGLKSPYYTDMNQLGLLDKKRVILARALVTEPEILVLDEPTAYLGSFSRKELTALLADLQREMGFTLIISTHDIQMVPSVSDRVYVLKDGCIIEEGSVVDVLSNLRLMFSLELGSRF